MGNTQFISIDNHIELYVETSGNPCDEACLFISGAGANSSFWSDQLCERLVNEKFFVVKYDHRDFGYSTKVNWAKDPYVFNQLAIDALTILNSLSINKTHIIGHSMGGFITQLLAINHPSRIISMTSISSSTSSPAIPPPPAKTWEIYLSNSPQNDYEKDLPGFLEVWRYLNGTAEFDKELAIQYTKNLYIRQVIDGALGASHVKAQETLTDRSKDLQNIQIPTLIMHGEEDYALDKYAGVQSAETIKNAELVIIPKMGHIPFNKEIRKQFENQIIRFIMKTKGSFNK